MRQNAPVANPDRLQTLLRDLRNTQNAILDNDARLELADHTGDDAEGLRLRADALVLYDLGTMLATQLMTELKSRMESTAAEMRARES